MRVLFWMFKFLNQITCFIFQGLYLDFIEDVLLTIQIDTLWFTKEKSRLAFFLCLSGTHTLLLLLFFNYYYYYYYILYKHKALKVVCFDKPYRPYFCADSINC